MKLKDETKAMKLKDETKAIKLKDETKAMKLNWWNMLESLDIGFFVSGVSSNGTYDYLNDPDVISTHRLFVVVVVVYIPLITGCNVIVFWGILLYPGFFTNNNMLLLSLAFADFLVGVYCLPMYFLSYIEATRVIVYSNKTSCIAWLTSGVLSAGGSLLSLLFIAIDRFVAIVWPLRYGLLITSERVVTSLILLWLCVFATSFAPLFGLNNYNNNIKNLGIRCNFYITLPKYYVYWSILGCAAPVVIVSGALYSQIIYIVWKQTKRLSSRQFMVRPEQALRLQNHMRSIKLSSFLMLAFVVLWSPYVSIAPFKYYNVFSQKSIEIAKCWSLLLTFGNSLINPVIYAIFREDYRQVYKVMLFNAPWRWKQLLRQLYVDKHTMKTNFLMVEIKAAPCRAEQSKQYRRTGHFEKNTGSTDNCGSNPMSRKISAMETIYESVFSDQVATRGTDVSRSEFLNQFYQMAPRLKNFVLRILQTDNAHSPTSPRLIMGEETTSIQARRNSADSVIFHDCLPP
ncbi:hypothetical protein Btru_048313 [Bulinus truncatus]|nr:hypothetical protein Btru_048313 [Bulinus truncatus]